MRLVIVLLLLAFALPAHARLDETEVQLVARYGPVVERSTAKMPVGDLPALRFEKNGYEIGAIMLDGKAGFIFFRKQDHTAMSDNEINLLLDADSAGVKWTKQPETSLDTWWHRDDGANAEYAFLDHGLNFYSADYTAAQEKVKKSAEDKNLQGF